MWVTDKKREGKVIAEQTHRSYVVETEDGTYQKNWRHLNAVPSQSSEELVVETPESTQGDLESETPPKPIPSKKVVMTCSRTGKAAPPPDRFK